MIETLFLAEGWRTRMIDAAREAFPRECCGLIEGLREGRVARVTAVHPARNLASEPDRFAIDPADHIALRRRLRGTGRAIIGCYHSHPTGRATPSERDFSGAEAGDPDFVWLIVALARPREGPDAAVGAFVPGPDRFRAIALTTEACASPAATPRATA